MGLELPKNLRLREGRYYARTQVGGREIERALDTHLLSEAKRKLKPALAQMREEAAKPAAASRTLGELVEQYRLSHVKRLRPRSQDRFDFALRALRQTISLDTPLDQISKDKLLAHQDRRIDAVGASTVRLELLQLSGMLRFAVDMDWLPSNPVPNFIRSRTSKLDFKDQRQRYLSRPEEDAALDFLCPSERDLVAFAIDTGLRRNEQFMSTWADVDWNRKEIRVPKARAKNGKERAVPLLDRAYDILLRRKQQAEMGEFYGLDRGIFGPHGGTLPPHKAQLVIGRIKMAGVIDLTWHDLRRTCGCRLLQDKGLTLDECAAWLGHSHSGITAKAYAFLDGDSLHRALARGRNKV